MATREFPKTDPAIPDFWEMRYRAALTPWDAGRVPVRLREWIARMPELGRVLVPGCGSGHDVRFLAEAGRDVVGIDFSPAAIEVARPGLGPFANRMRLADFFGPEVRGPYGFIYERAFLCALPRRLWQDWAKRVAELVPGGGWLAGFFYVDDGERGPPFPLHHQDELDTLLVNGFVRREDLPVDDSISVFAGKERWQARQRL